MKNAFLDYYKVILSKVSFDRELLQKEYRKALSSLNRTEAHELVRWANEKGLNLGEQPTTFEMKSGWVGV